MADNSNLGKNALIIGAVLGLAAGGYGGYTMTSNKVVKPATEVSSTKIDDSMVAGAQALRDSLKKDRSVKDCAPEGATINGKPRLAPLFYQTELWQISIDAQKKNTVVDIYDPKSPSIHGSVPNTWFISNGIADALGRSDGLTIDSDQDGFSNGEEHAAGSKPNDATSYPNLVSDKAAPKLEVVKVDVARAIVTLDGMFATESKPESVSVRIFQKISDMTPSHKISVKVGDSFGLTKDDNSRFTVLGFEQKEFPDYGGAMSPENVIRVRDNVTASNEKEFTIRAGKPTARSKENGTPHEKGRRISDTTVTLRVTAGSAYKKPEGTIAAQLNGTFDIPGGISSGEKMSATIESVDASGSVNIKVSGMESPVNIPKAQGKSGKSPKK